MSRVERSAVEGEPMAGPVVDRPTRSPGPDARPKRMIPITPEGWPFILVPLALALLIAWLGWLKVAIVPLALAAFMAYFFRDPERTPPAMPQAILAPADGRVVEVRDAGDDRFVGPARQVSIFLSPFDVHVNRIPITGRVVDVEYRPGAFLAAYRPEASERNERTSVAIEGAGGRLTVRQVAGVLARRIVCRVRPGDRVQAGQRFGMIKFGSRMDVVMPRSARLRVGPGDRVRAGESVLAVME